MSCLDVLWPGPSLWFLLCPPIAIIQIIFFFSRFVIAVQLQALPYPWEPWLFYLMSCGFATFLASFCSAGGYPAVSLLFLSIVSENECRSCFLDDSLIFSLVWWLAGIWFSVGLTAQLHHLPSTAWSNEFLYACGDLNLGI